MSSEIALLQDIKLAVWLLVYIVGTGVALIMFKTIAISYRAVKTELKNVFYNDGAAMYENGQFRELIEYSHSRLKKKPGDAYALLFLGKAHYKIKEYEKAKEYLNKVIEIYPSWEEEWVAPVLVKIIEAERNATPAEQSA